MLGVRREDKNRWERRAPLTPKHVKELVSRGIKVVVQPSSLRTFSDRQYEEAGAIIQEDLSEVSTIVAVKEVPIDLLMEKKTYMFFSHTIKAQPTNMRMLDEILEKKIRLIDYEGITDDNGKRLVRFGKFAGYAGTIDMMHALGDRLLALGHSTPFLHIGYSYCYSSVEAAKEAVSAMGEEIENFGLPNELVPFTFVFTSEGNVSQGAQEIFKQLPHEMVTVEQMADLVAHKEKASPFKVYGTVVTAKDWARPLDSSKKFAKEDYYAHPEKYSSVFAEEIAPYASVIVNCMFWNPHFPRLLTMNQMEEMEENKSHRLLCVCDISCDRMGSIEFLIKTTSIDQPLFIYDPRTRDIHDSTTDQDFIYNDGILMIAVDNFPTEFPKEATQWFGDNLIPFLETVVRSNPTLPYSEMKDLPQEIYKAVIACQGKLTPQYQYITELRKANEKTLRNVLLLGAGFVAAAAVDYLSRNPKITITIADMNVSAAEQLSQGRPNCSAVKLDVKDSSALENLITHQSIVVSLLPATLNVVVGKACLKQGKHLVTASYIAPAFKEIHAEVEAAGLTFLNEMGLDPGIDHLEALRVIESVREKGGKIRSFVSWCGGLPMPEASQNPLGYKFSWSPRGVLTAATRDAKYLQEGKLIEIPGSKLFGARQPVDIFPGFNLEGIPNRDALPYAKEYGIEGEVSTMFRGTLRYTGYCEVMEAVVALGLLDETPQEYLSPEAPSITWKNLLRKLIGAFPEAPIRQSVKLRLKAPGGFPAKAFSAGQIKRVLDFFKWLGMFSDKEVDKKGTLLDTFCAILGENPSMQYGKYESDMVLLHHIFGIEWPDGSHELRNSTLVIHGTKKGMAMSRSVGIPVALAAELIMEGSITRRGVVGPMTKEIYRPVLKALANEGMRFVEKSKMVAHGFQ